MSARGEREFWESERCCVCMHPLDTHVPEEGGWRCHSLGGDLFQCECWLRENRSGDEGRDHYRLSRRIEKMQKIIERDKKMIVEAEKNE